MDQGDAEVLERIRGGERTFRPGATTEAARVSFEAMVAHLRELRGRGFIDMPERSLTQTEDIEAGAYLMAGPCYLTEAGRLALDEFRRSGRRGEDRRHADRRQVIPPPPPPDAGDRRTGDRRRGDRRR